MQNITMRLRDDQTAALQRISRETGREQHELISRGVDLVIRETEDETPAPKGTKDDWRQAWLDAAGIWKDRTDIDEIYGSLRDADARRADERERQWRGE